MGRLGNHRLGLTVALTSAIALPYLAIATFLRIAGRRLIYRPADTFEIHTAPDLILETAGASLRGWTVNPGHPNAAIYFGGNGERVEDARDDLARLLPNRTSYLLAYRGFAGSDGRPTELALVSDALAQFDEFSQRHERIAVIGRSLGSAVAIQLAAQRPVERLVLVTPFDSIARVAQAAAPIFSMRALLPDTWQSHRYAGRVRCPVLVLRAQQDEVIAPARTNALLAALPTATVVSVAYAGHNDLHLSAEYQQALQAFLD